MLPTHITAKGVIIPVFKGISENNKNQPPKRNTGKGHEQRVNQKMTIEINFTYTKRYPTSFMIRRYKFKIFWHTILPTDLAKSTFGQDAPLAKL